MKKLDHFDMRVLNSSPLLLPADGLKPGDKSLDLPFCLMRAARRAFEDWVKTHPKDWKETVRQARETGATEADRLYRQERERVLAANSHDHYLAEKDRKEGY